MQMHTLGMFWLQAAVEEQDTFAMFTLAKELLRKESPSHDSASATALLQSGASLGDQSCTAALAYHFIHNTNIIRNQRYAAQANLRAARAGDLHAMHNLSAQYHNGEGVPVDQHASNYWRMKWLDKLAEVEPGLPDHEREVAPVKKEAKLIRMQPR